MSENIQTQNPVILLYNIVNYGNWPIAKTEEGFTIKTPKEFVEVIAEPGMVTYKINGKYIATTHSSMMSKANKQQINDLFDILGKIYVGYMKQNLK